MKILLLVFCLLATTFLCSIHSIAIDDFHCKIPTCRDFFYGLKNYPRRDAYEKICFQTVFKLQAIPRKYGTCIRSDTKTLNAPCIRALASTIKGCITQLDDLPENVGRFYCGYTLMKYCAVYLGLDGYVLNFNETTS